MAWFGKPNNINVTTELKHGVRKVWGLFQIEGEDIAALVNTCASHI
jgi:hypothetical protein